MSLHACFQALKLGSQLLQNSYSTDFQEGLAKTCSATYASAVHQINSLAMHVEFVIASTVHGNVVGGDSCTQMCWCIYLGELLKSRLHATSASVHTFCSCVHQGVQI